MTQLNVLVVTKGHPFDRGQFFDLFDELGFNWTHVEQPAARAFFTPDMAVDYDVIALYDMPGIKFGPEGVELETPSEAYKRGFLDLLESGKGLVFMHHAIAGWPAWPEYAEIIGGRFLYLPAELRGLSRLDSGYRHEVRHQLSKVSDHEVTAGLPDKFPMTDELYLHEVFEDSVIPLLTSDYGFSSENFYSAAKVVLEGRMFDNENWQHPNGANLVAWVKHYLNSPIAYIQGGDDPVAWQSKNYQQLLKNAISWAASDGAMQWARSQREKE
jgi:type 1 glutamine amidotransferase